MESDKYSREKAKKEDDLFGKNLCSNDLPHLHCGNWTTTRRKLTGARTCCNLIKKRETVLHFNGRAFGVLSAEYISEQKDNSGCVATWMGNLKEMDAEL
ncbi:hypothetical protein TcasGA2_TC032100 [Tribolium castaneum]|uniref:Uncharacterized protein n=1 Tax=Tribolium castaneum TaxID=7070 RepID=A0A139WMF6_TRICA|nr:hypothetical protein TcasGA2_TC032100 [Tribolium castaneum]